MSRVEHQAADALSRILTDGMKPSPLNDETTTILDEIYNTKDEEKKTILAEMRMAEWMDIQVAALLCTVESESASLNFQMAVLRSTDPTPISLEEFL